MFSVTLQLHVKQAYACIWTCITGIGALYSAYIHSRDAHTRTTPMYYSYTIHVTLQMHVKQAYACITGIGAFYSIYIHSRDVHIRTTPMYYRNKHNV